MRYLVTGGAGFIGSHLCEHLLRRGDEVVVLDDLSTGAEHNLAAVTGHPRLRLRTGSAAELGTVLDAARDVDGIFHLAAAVGVFAILDHPLRSLRTNLHGTESVLEAARQRGIPMLLASTSEVYGKNDKPGLREEDDRVLGAPQRNRWSYADAKAIDEALTYCYHREFGLGAVVVRLFNTVGPRQRGHYGMVLPRFVAQALANEPLTVFGDGSQVRCFCHVDDVVPAMHALLTEESAHGTAYNLGSAEPVSIRELAERVIAVTGSASEIVTVPYSAAYGPGYEDMTSRIPDCTRARERVGFAPRHSLEQIIESVVAANRASLRSVS
ncbi:NAD-dependent epimerase/dehydratase family protein [Sciscionella sediminilitoris]|uniref:NAD-dependent epimerase/dehydratase family protein n=1 Tax=Sciscionella sediminilitoris TaxID=1445613 RepID=UPI0004DFC8E4|nr:NAD-dependent epimerase/dehydratase family protein [Sciscionella sp. SE31]